MAEDKKKSDKECWESGGKDCGPRKEPPLIGPFNKGQFKFSVWFFILFLLALGIINIFFSQMGETPLDFSDFKKKIESGEIKQVIMGEQYYIGRTYTKEELKNGRFNEPLEEFKTVPVFDPGFVTLMDNMNVAYSSQPVQSGFLSNLLVWLVPVIVMVVIWRFMFKRLGNMGSNVLNFGRNKSQIVAEGDIDVTFNDVAGADEAKEELVEVVDFLKNPKKYTSIGGKIPNGVLLVGPPGCGKTLMAKAVAGEAGVTFFRISGADFVEMFVGVGAARVRDMFKQARAKAPCIIFIDELDAIAKSRVTVIGGNDEREQTLNQLLVEMDGFDSVSGVIVLGATNRPEILDPAILRPGRFDRQVVMDRPDLAGREAILQIHAKNVIMDETVDLKAVAKATAGFVGADLANIINEAALLAVRAGRQKVNQKDFDEAIEKIIAGLQKKNKLINPREREIVAYHETGHALVAAFTSGADPVHKISIVPRGISALGYTLQLPTEDRFLMTKDELLGKVDILLGGRAAEKIIFDQVSTGAANDLVNATEIVRKMITDYGMSEKFKNMVLHSRKNPSFLGERAELNTGVVREYSENTQQYIDEEVARIINEQYEKVLSLLQSKLETLKKVARKLLEIETLDAEAFKALI